MAATDSAFDHLGEKVHKMATDMADTSKSAEGLHTSFVKLIGAFAGARAIEHVFQEIVHHSALFQVLSKATARENLNSYALSVKGLALESSKLDLEERIRDAAGGTAAIYGLQLRAVTQDLELHEKQVKLADQLRNFGYARLVVIGATVGATTALYRSTMDFNRALIKSNTDIDHRNTLMQQSLLVQRQTGLSFEHVTHAAAALANYGLDAQASFSDNLKLVTQMESGLGVSVDESARLATIVERQLHGSFKAVADVVADIVNNTALAGNEAMQLATTIGTAMSRLGPGVGAAGLPDVLRLVGRYEGALKEVGGQAGGVQQLLAHLTSTQGVVGAGVLNIGPEFLATSNGVQTVMDRFLRYGDQLVGQTRGWDRQWRLQAMGDMFGISADQANHLMMAIKHTSLAQGAAITVQQRWKAQMDDAYTGITRLGNSLVALMQQAVGPLVPLIGSIANKVADLVEGLASHETAVGVTMAALAVGLAASIPSMLKLAWTLRAVALGGLAASARLSGMSGAGSAGMLSGAFSNFTVGGTVAASAAIGVALAGIAYILYKIYDTEKYIREATESAAAQQTVIASLQDTVIRKAEREFYVAAKYHPEQADVALRHLLEQASVAADNAGYKSDGDPAARKAYMSSWIANEKAMAERVMARVIDDTGMFTPYSSRTTLQQQQLKALQDLSSKLSTIATTVEDGLGRATKQAADIQAANDIDNAKDRTASGRANTLKGFEDNISEFLFQK